MIGMFGNLTVFVEWLLRTSVQSSFIILVIFGVRFIFGKVISVRWMYFLWVLLLIRMLVPSLPYSSLSPANLMPETAKKIYNSPVKIDTESFDLQTDLETEPLGFSTMQESANSNDAGADINARVRSKGIDIFTLFTLIWFIGAIFWLIYMIVSNLKIYKCVVKNRPLTDQRILNLLEDCKAKMSLNIIVGLIPVKEISSPAIFGFLRPRLLLPAEMFKNLSQQDLEHVFMHELGHIKRNDILINWVSSFLLILHWFNPFVWIAFSKMRNDRELACDRLVLSRLQPESQSDYGKSILNLLDKYKKSSYVPSMAGILEEKTQIKRRIKMISEFKKNKLSFTVITGIVLSLFAFSAFTTAKEKGGQDLGPEQLATKFVDDLLGGNYGSAVKQFDKTMKEQMPEEKLKAVWQGIKGQAGEFQKRLGVRDEVFLSSKIIFVTCRFEKGPLDIKVVYDEDKNVSGLWFLPTPSEILNRYEKDNWDKKEKDAYKIYFRAANSSLINNRQKMLQLFNKFITPKDAKTFRFKYDPESKFACICTYTQKEQKKIIDMLSNNQHFKDVSPIETGKPTSSSKGKPFREIKYDNGESGGRESINGGVHIVKFENGAGKLLAVRIYGSRYGANQPPNEDFYVYVYDKDMVLVEKFDFPYSRFMKGDRNGNPRGWVTLKVKPTTVPDEFYLAVDFNPHKTKGVYVHYDNVLNGSSFIGNSSNHESMRTFEKGDWMIRAVVKNVLPANPVVLETNPVVLRNDVSPDLKQITVKFDRPMIKTSYSWTGGGETFPEIIGKPMFNDDGTLGILNVKLKPGKVYWVGINSPSHKNFRSVDGNPAQRYVILFATADKNGNNTRIPDNMLSDAKMINAENR